MAGAIAFPDPPLAADGVILRNLESGDVGWITAACDDREMNRYIPAIPYPYARSDAIAFAEEAARGWENARRATFVIAESPHRAGLGMIELHVAESDPGLAEVGYWLRRAARGRGAATTALRLVSAWAFRDLGVQRLNLTTAPANEASQRVAGRVGFTREGLLRAWLPVPDGRRDSVMFSLLPGDSRGRKAP